MHARLGGLLIGALFFAQSGLAETRLLPKPLPVVTTAPAAGVLLVAHRELQSPAFTQSVVLLLRNDTRGTIGVIVNRRTRFALEDILPDIGDGKVTGHSVFLGGPVAPQVVVMLMRREKPETGIERVTDEIVFSTEREVLTQLIARNKPAADVRFYVGHASWAVRQLDNELAHGVWYVVSSTADTIFGDDEENLWERLINRLDPPGIRVQRPHTTVVSGLAR